MGKNGGKMGKKLGKNWEKGSNFRKIAFLAVFHGRYRATRPYLSKVWTIHPRLSLLQWAQKQYISFERHSREKKSGKKAQISEK